MGVIGKVGDFYCGTSACAHVKEFCAISTQKQALIDEIQVEVDGVIYLQVIDSQKASYGITDFQYASIQLAQTTTRAIIGTLDLDRTFEEREAISV